MPTVTFPGRPLASYPVMRFFYKVLYSGTILVRLPVWMVKFSLFKSARPLPTWSFRQSILLRLFTEYIAMTSRAETPVPLSLEPGKEKDRWEVLSPHPQHLYRGPLASDTIEPAVIGGTWYPDRPTDAAEAGPIVMHIHGGAFVTGDGRSDFLGPMFNSLHKHGKIGHMFAPDYRLSSRPTSVTFPAALQDVLTSYLYLVRTLGVSASDVTVSGDSAGGNLALALLRYLAEHGEALGIPQPACAVVISPWVAPVRWLWPDIAIMSNPNVGSDYLGLDLCRWGAKTYMRGAEHDDPYIVPLGRPFATPVPVLATFGGAEIIAVDGIEWAREMQRVEGNELDTYIEPGAPHDTLLVGHFIGFEESSAKVAQKIGDFIRQHA